MCLKPRACLPTLYFQSRFRFLYEAECSLTPQSCSYLSRRPSPPFISKQIASKRPRNRVTFTWRSIPLRPIEPNPQRSFGDRVRATRFVLERRYGSASTKGEEPLVNFEDVRDFFRVGADLRARLFFSRLNTTGKYRSARLRNRLKSFSIRDRRICGFPRRNADFLTWLAVSGRGECGSRFVTFLFRGPREI